MAAVAITIEQTASELSLGEVDTISLYEDVAFYRVWFSCIFTWWVLKTYVCVWNKYSEKA